MDIKVKNLYKKYDDKIIFKDFNITFKENKVNTIVGKSGCGKTTLLKIISNIEEKDSGKIEGVNINSISYIFQEDRLVEWLTVKENLKLILKNDYRKEELDGICKKYLNLVGVQDFENYYPQSLSGGIRQRVNIARAFAKPSKLIIMDEPFKSIDIKNKNDIMKAFENVFKEETRTVLFVTHDIDEAIYFMGQIYILGGNPVSIKAIFNSKQIEDKKQIINLI
ncbi:ABC transporter ATP-binding protein [Romboutsia sp. 1001713B170131_170501_G6]|uniref:ABC transporter ATP-binding protein n=1 Tax=Romboutsia sp. 1001713B170131_170501_G6 TaxID=2787108 RepID=UPI0018AAD2A8|nr:ABC transporter ATP-binding protein [Romboutsia sp. 1001713B170131_170501_G6]